MSEQPKIVTRCPYCGGQSFFIGEGWHLICARLDCAMPSLDESIAHLKHEIELAYLRGKDYERERIKTVLGLA